MAYIKIDVSTTTFHITFIQYANILYTIGIYTRLNQMYRI